VFYLVVLKQKKHVFLKTFVLKQAYISRVHYQRNLVSSVVFVPQWVSSSKKVIPRRYL